MRQAATALLAVPILVTVYIGASLRRSTPARVSLALGLSLALGVGVVGAGRPTTAVATPPSPIVPLTSAAFATTLLTDHGLTEPATIAFTTPMDAVSVDAALAVEPDTPVTLSWDTSGTILTIAPQPHWPAGTLHTVTVTEGALAQTGQPLIRPARAAFLTRAAMTASVVATEPIDKRVSIDTSFLISFAGPVDDESVRAGVRLEPATAGAVRSSSPTDGPGRYTFTPSAPLRPGVAYRVVVSGVHDADGLALAPLAVEFRTIKAPAVVRFRPRADTTDVARSAVISVRFTRPMERRTTARAFSVSVGGSTVSGKVRWAERDTVLVFTPSAPLPFGARVEMDVAAGARDAAGVRLGAPGHGTFRTIAKPVAAAPAAAPPAAAPPATGGTGSGGGAVGGGSWAAVETYYLGLMNCTRTGGWVTSTGSCSSPGGRDVAPLKLDAGISSKVSRPYAKKLAVAGVCSHAFGSSPTDRLRRAGYTSYRWGENLGCRSGSPRGSVLGSHLFFQSEKSYNGGHYVNLMNAKYDRAGIGVWVYEGRVRLVVDFYHP